MVKIYYSGSDLTLQGRKISIPVDPYIRHNFVLDSAAEYISAALPGVNFSTIPDIFETIPKGSLVTLLNWKIVDSELSH